MRGIGARPARGGARETVLLSPAAEHASRVSVRERDDGIDAFEHVLVLRHVGVDQISYDYVRPGITVTLVYGVDKREIEPVR